MNPPKCKVCGWEHWPGNPHYTSDEPNAAPSPVSVRIDPAKRGRGRPISDAPKSPRAEYQRGLMRKRRAAAKEAKP